MAGLTWRATWFDNRMTDPVSNVTVATNTVQRQNLGATRIVGIQNDVEYHIDRWWSVAAGYLYNSAKVTENPANTTLVGLYLPQVPKHRGSVEVTFARPEWFTANVMVFASGLQYDDDLNVASIPGYGYPGLPKFGTVSFTVSRQIFADVRGVRISAEPVRPRVFRRYRSIARRFTADGDRWRARARQRPLGDGVGQTPLDRGQTPPALS
jgi:hypothetical protein